MTNATALPDLRLVEAATAPEVLANAPLSQKAHELMLQSLDKVCGDWIEQLKRVRSNSEAVEAMVLQRVAKVKNDVDQLYLLGNAVMAEANRGDMINRELAEKLDQLTEDQL